ncbi:DNA repair protein RadA [Peredibacter starrii]|uniref:DNA repair protein RadA n=1 Tax=Peredibacter starrii TaxID=28202 RepID=A0AAX4HPX5_9BACT|nr:DNA repair protein RadA [Peredibacter starrii]WPU65376.1 DNA repair protein RadA [Peredibacter starrii]
MAKIKTVFTCQECGYKSAKWLGKCPDCNQWNSFSEEETIKPSKASPKSVTGRESRPKTIDEIEHETVERYQTKIGEFDRVMGGGVTVGSLTLIGGEPGIGKSTLLMEVCGKLLNEYGNERILYVSGEESESQVAGRSKRLGVNNNGFYIFNETNWQKVLEQVKELKPKFLVLDSIQTTHSNQVESAAGTLTQIREVTYELMNFAKAYNLTCFLIGHVTKEGQIAGPKILEHMVDTVIYFEGDQLGQYRMLRVMKNRFGNTNEVGIFEMQETGLREIKNPSQYFLEQSIPGSYGRSLTCILEGSRSLFVEIQALVVENKFSQGRRTTQGLDSNRVALLVAVIDKYLGIPLSYNDIYVNVVGGMKLTTRENDLSVIASLLSSYYQTPIPNDTIFLGEVGLTGEVRSVPMMEMRLKEIAQMNYKRVITSKRAAEDLKGKYKLEIVGISKASELKNLLFK